MDEQDEDALANKLREAIDKVVLEHMESIESERAKHIIPMLALSAAMGDAGCRFVARGGRLEPDALTVATLIRTSPWATCARDAVARWKLRKVRSS